MSSSRMGVFNPTAHSVGNDTTSSSVGIFSSSQKSASPPHPSIGDTLPNSSWPLPKPCSRQNEGRPLSQYQFSWAAETRILENIPARSDPIRPRGLRAFTHHAAKLRLRHSAVYRGLCDLHAQFSTNFRFERQLREYHGLCDLHE